MVEQEILALLVAEAEVREAQQMEVTQLFQLVARVEQAILQQEMELMEFRLVLREILVQFMVAVVLEQKMQLEEAELEHQELELMVI